MKPRVCAAALVLLLAGCGEDTTNTAVLPSGSTGTLAVTLQRTPLRAVPINDGVRRFDVAVRDNQGRLLGTGSAVNQTLPTTVTIANLPAGTHTVTVVGRDANLDGVGTGVLPGTVGAGQTTTLTLASLDEPASLRINPASSTITRGATQAYTVLAVSDTGATSDVTHGASFQSANPAVAAVDFLGQALGQSDGSTTITARFNSRLSATANLTVGSGATSLTIPTSDFATSNGIRKTGINCSIGGGPPVLTEVDTGSDALVVEREFLGNQVELTNVSLTITYNAGRDPRQGVLAFAPYSLLDHSGQVVLNSTRMPIMVVNAGVVSNNGNNPNRAIFGVGTGTNVSPKLFLAPPYNQMLLLDRPGRQLSFGTFPANDFAVVPLNASTGTNPFANPSPGPSPFGSPLPTPAGSPLGTYNDKGLPVEFTFGDTPPQQIQSLLDTGASSTIQAPTATTPGIRVNGQDIVSPVNAVVLTAQGPRAVFFNQPIVYDHDTSRTTIFCNLGNEMANHYTVLLDQAHGFLGLGSLPSRSKRR